MEVMFLKNDGRCKWVEKKVLQKLIPEIIRAAMEPGKRTPMYLIEDWISNDSGKVGVDIKWLKHIGVPVIKSVNDLPPSGKYAIVNTGYDSIVDEEQQLLERGVELIDEPCPYVRKVREIFENKDQSYQYVLLCEPNHIIVKNFKSLFPQDLILVQMCNYQEEILRQQNGKPLRLVPYVTFLPGHIQQVADFINQHFPRRPNDTVQTSCMWIASPSSPIIELNGLSREQLKGIKDALVITSAGSMNKSLVSLMETIESKGLNVVPISSLKQFRAYRRKNRKSRVLLVRTPIPNQAEKPVVTYIKHGLIMAWWEVFVDFLKLRYSKYFVVFFFKIRQALRLERGR